MRRAPLGLLALVAVSALLRTRALEAGYWIDEGISVGIASQSLGDLPDLLRGDGSPPLYFVLLHGWIALLGAGEEATHALSLVFALATVPAAWWAAQRPFGPRGAWTAAALAAVNPFLTQYAQETRPYALAVLLGTLLAGAHLRAFVLGGRRAVAATGLLAAALALTHHWGWYLIGGLALATAAAAPRRPAAARDGLLVLAIVGAVYLPWLTVTIGQIQHTGAPWSITPGPEELADVLLVPFGGVLPVALLAGAGTWALRRRGADARPAAVLGAAVLVAFAAAFAVAQAEPGWAGRYLAVVCGPLLVVAAWALARAGRAGLGVLVAVLIVWALDAPPEPKSNVREVAAQLSRALAEGDLVLVAHPEQIAVARHYLGGRLRYATTLGPQPDPRAFDWRDALARLHAADPRATLRRVRGAAPASRRIAILLPVDARTENRNSPWLRLVRARARTWHRLLEATGRPMLVTPGPGAPEPPRAGVVAVVYAL